MVSEDTPFLQIAGENNGVVTAGTSDGQVITDYAVNGVKKVSVDVGDDKKKELEKPSVPLREVLGRLFREVQGIKLLFFLGLICGSFAGGAFATWAYLFGEMISILNRTDVGDRATEILFVFWTAGGCFGVLVFFQYFFFIRMAGKIGASMRLKFYCSLLYMEMSFFDKESTGALATKLLSEGKVIEVGLGNQFGQAFQCLGMFLGGFTVAFTRGWLYTFILLGFIPLVAVGGAIAGKFISEMSKKGADIYSEASARSAEVFSGFDTILSLNAGRGEAARYEALVKMKEPTIKKKAFRIGTAMGSMQFINNGYFYGLGMYIGALLVEWYNNSGGDRGSSAGEVFAVFFGMFIAGMGIGQFGTTIPDVSAALVSCQNLFDIIDRIPEIRKPDDGKECIEMKISGTITFEHVSFTYPSRPDVQVLRNISLEIKSGETVALVGHSGCGKSTIISLLERFYDPDDGRILIDGVPIWNLYPTNWRGQLGYVGQEPVLFNGTIADNILHGTNQTNKGDYSHSDVQKAARQANAHNFITDFPGGYNTKVGEGGGQLSGGQKQRVSIARALVRNPQILLLDEATSALDTESEKVVQAALDNIIAQGNRTCIVIAHRLSTIVNADKIVVFRNGEIVQIGKFDNLSKDTNGVFHVMLMAQDVLGAMAQKPI